MDFKVFIAVLASILHLSYAQINANDCGKTTCCFRSPLGCASSQACDILISYRYNNATSSINVAIGGKHAWVAFGLASTGGVMDGASGEVCFKDSATPRLSAFSNSGYSPNFGRSTVGLSNIMNNIQNGAVICNYSRPVVPPSGGSYMKDLSQTLFITVAFGDTVTGSSPRHHETSGFSSSAKIDFKKICTSATVSGKSVSKIHKNVVAHGALMVVAWMIFAASGMFIARYTRPVAKDDLCLGQKIWFQSHRIFMAVTLLLTIISFIIIFVHRGGWSEHAKAHPVTGCITTLLAMIQPIMAAFRPHPTEDNRWIFNWAHRSVGCSALILAAVTIFLGLKLVNIERTVVIIWIVISLVLIVVTEIVLFCISNKTKGDYHVEKSAATVDIGDDKTITFRKIVFILAFVGFLALGLTAVVLIAKAA